MSCTWDPDLLQMYLDDTLASGERAVVAAHLRECRSCRRELRRLQALYWELDHMDPAPLPGETREALDAQAEALLQAWEAVQAAERAEARSRLRLALPTWAGLGLPQMEWMVIGPAQGLRYLPGSQQLQRGLVNAGQKLKATGLRALSRRALPFRRTPGSDEDRKGT